VPAEEVEAPEAPSSEEPQASADAETGQTLAAELPVEEAPESQEETPADDAEASSPAEETEE
jgi:hypothetical protein